MTEQNKIDKEIKRRRVRNLILRGIAPLTVYAVSGLIGVNYLREQIPVKSETVQVYEQVKASLDSLEAISENSRTPEINDSIQNLINITTNVPPEVKNYKEEVSRQNSLSNKFAYGFALPGAALTFAFISSFSKRNRKLLNYRRANN